MDESLSLVAVVVVDIGAIVEVNFSFEALGVMVLLAPEGLRSLTKVGN